MIVVNRDGKIEEAVDVRDPVSTATIPQKNINEITYRTKLVYEENRKEYDKRCARNGKCPHDSKPCKHYRSCVLKKAETCLNFTPKSKKQQDAMVCSVCINRPVTGHYWRCKRFECMVAYKGRT